MNNNPNLCTPKAEIYTRTKTVGRGCPTVVRCSTRPLSIVNSTRSVLPTLLLDLLGFFLDHLSAAYCQFHTPVVNSTRPLSIPHARCQFHKPVVNSTRPLSISHTRCQFHTRLVAISDHLIGPHHQFYALAFFIAHMHKKRKKGLSCFGTQGPGFNFYTPVVELTPVFF
jgi:hypothetical protein